MGVLYYSSGSYWSTYDGQEHILPMCKISGKIENLSLDELWPGSQYYYSRWAIRSETGDAYIFATSVYTNLFSGGGVDGGGEKFRYSDIPQDTIGYIILYDQTGLLQMNIGIQENRLLRIIDATEYQENTLAVCGVSPMDAFENNAYIFWIKSLPWIMIIFLIFALFFFWKILQKIWKKK